MKDTFSIRNAVPGDLEAVINLDYASTGESKHGYWQGVFSHYVDTKQNDRLFLVAEAKGVVAGFIVGEIRAWEFGSPPCGWVFALSVLPDTREMGIGKRLFEEISNRLKQAGVATIRTMVDRDDKLMLSFFRGMGLRTGKYIELEKSLD